MQCFKVLDVRGFQTVVLFIKYVRMFLQILCILFVRGLYGLHVGGLNFRSYVFCQGLLWFTCRRVSSGHVFFVGGFYGLSVVGFLHV